MPFVKGQSGNPGGRPSRDNSLTGLLRRELGKKESAEDNATRKQRLTDKLIELALNGDTVAIKYIFDRIDGKPTETVKADIQGDLTMNNAIAVAAKLEEVLNADG
jgi:hypothetical protein